MVLLYFSTGVSMDVILLSGCVSHTPNPSQEGKLESHQQSRLCCALDNNGEIFFYRIGFLSLTYHSENFRKPSRKLVLGLKPKSASKAEVSA